MIRFLTRYGTTRGIFGGSRAWTAVAILAWAVRLAQRSRGKEAKVVYSEVLHPGQTIEVRHLPDPSKTAAPRR